MNWSEFWAAFGALGQWACAIATLGAVIVALKPYRRKIIVKLSNVVLKSNGKCEVISYILNIRNKGYIKETIVCAGIESKDGNFILSENEMQIEERGFATIAIKRDDLLNNLSLIDDKYFRFWIQDSAGYSFCSKRYLTEKYKKDVRTSKPFG